METILVLLHTEAGAPVGKAGLEVLEAARGLGGDVAIGLVGADCAAAAASVAGAGRLLAVEGEAFAQPRYATDASAAEALVKAAGAGIVLAPATSRWARCLPGVAQRAAGRIDTHVTGLNDGTLTRWYYRQRIEASLRRAERPWFLLLEAGIGPAYAAAGAAGAAYERVTAEPGSRTEAKGVIAPQSGEQTIKPEAELLFVAGAGWTKKQKDGAVHMDRAAELILGMLKGSGASLGSSKSLVDLSGEGHAVLPFLSHLNQVGQTGSTPRHAKGLATCCHGEEPHVVGWRFIQDRRAVNLDANCGWARGKADVLYVADAFEVMEELNRLLG
ncbi:MAG: electron transfer flavoprotein subunit alpha [Bryobacterales bacterium]|nr:electron transfer flavoprotein subunit alpha [Bryobacterales bacterium]